MPKNDNILNGIKTNNNNIINDGMFQFYDILTGQRSGQ